MPDLTSDTVEYQILLEATKAVQDLEKVTVGAANADDKMRLAAQAVADFSQKLGIAAPVAEAMFRRVEQSAAQLQMTMAKLQAQGASMPALNALGQGLMNVNPVFPPAAVGSGEQAATSAEMWKGVHVQLQQIIQEQEQFDALVRQTNNDMNLLAKSAAGLTIPIKTATDTMASLKVFAESQKGQGILQNFLTGYQGADSMVGKINAIKTAIFQMSKETGASFQQTGNLLKSSFNIPDVQVTNAIKKLNQELGNTPEQAQRAVRSIDAVRIALGAIVAMIVFQAIQAITQFFTTAVKSAREYEGTLYNVANAERIMSQQGVEIAPKDLQEMIDNLQKLIPMLSRVDATKAVGNLALFTKDLGYTKDQIGDLANAIGVLYVRNRALGLSFEQVQSQVQTGLLTGRAQGIRDLGVSISESQIQNEALRMGLVKTAKEFQALTGDVETQVKAQAMLGLILRSTAEEQKNLGQYMETNDARIAKFSAKFADMKLLAGQHLFGPLLADLADMGTALLSFGEQIDNLRTKLTSRLLAALIVFGAAMRGQITSFSDLKKGYADVLAYLDASAEKYQKVAALEDTATGATENLTQSVVDLSNVDMSSLEKSLLSISERLSDLNRDFAQKNANYTDEFNTKMERMQEDYATEVQNTLQDFANRRADLEAQYRNQQLDAEAKYQEQLRELRTKYLYDLEDALRNRDARQVLRLQAQYKMDQTNLKNNFEIDSAARARQYKTELAQLQRSEQQKLAEMAKAEAIKETRAREDFAREQAQRKQEYENQLADLQRSWDDRLKEEADKIAEDQGLNEAGAKAIYEALQKYYGKDAMIDTLFRDSLESLKNNGAAMLAELSGIITQYQAVMASTMAMTPGWSYNENVSGSGMSTPPLVTSFSGSENSSTGQSKARGGIDFATKPTTVTFGDAGPEMAIFLPAGKGLGDVPNNLPGMGGQQSLNGLIRLAIDLHPDLEARITENTLKRAADITTHVYRRRS